MKMTDLQYDLPLERIAQHPPEDRLDARLLVAHRQTGRLEDRAFCDLTEYLRPPDLLVVNDTRVLPAKFDVFRPTGGRIEGLFLNECQTGQWEVLLRGAAKIPSGEPLRFRNDAIVMTIIESLERGRYRIAIDPPAPAQALLDRVGKTPLPPYIRRDRNDQTAQDPADRQRYQTVYANRPGAVAAPTAGLHFTTEFLDDLAADGIDHAPLTLDVGIGTFSPVTAEQLAAQRMHIERYNLPAETVERIGRAKQKGGRLVAVGTTTTRALEGCVAKHGRLTPGPGQTDLFIQPGYRFAAVDALITNFHLPGSTLLSLVFALASRELIMTAYRHAIDQEYRFYSYGDAMLIL
jgi:S-adenosylmethionine:tRNA ribosyltransferase-isomerase